MAVTCGANLFGTKAQFIKTNGGDFVAVDGSGIRERIILSDLRIPYKQILKSRVILKTGQVNYLLNFLGLGDNATFLCMKALYDSKSVIEADNYVNWSYYDDMTRVNSFADTMVLTGNSTHRVPQLYLTNPSTKYPVYIDIMVGVIDDSYSIFTDTLNQSGTSFVNLNYTDIHSHVVGESIVINDKSSPVKPLIYIRLSDINSIERSGQILIIDDSSLGTKLAIKTKEFSIVTIQSPSGSAPQVGDVDPDGTVIQVTLYDGYFPTHYRNTSDKTSGMENSYYNGSKQTIATTLDGTPPIETFTTNGNL